MAEKMIPARVLVQCSFGAPDDLVEVTKEQAEASKDTLDTSEGAVRYAVHLAAARKAEAEKAAAK